MFVTLKQSAVFGVPIRHNDFEMHNVMSKSDGHTVITVIITKLTIIQHMACSEEATKYRNRHEKYMSLKHNILQN